MNSGNINNTFCKELVEYRDNQLYKSYSKAYNRVKIFSEAKRDAEKNRAQVMDDRNWIGSNGMEAAMIVLLVVKFTANLIEDLLAFSPSAKGVSIASTIYKAIKATKSVGQVNNIVEKSASFPQGEKAMKAFSALKHFAENIMLFDTVTKDSAALRNDLNRLYNQIDHELSIIIVKLHNAETDRDEIEKIKQGIDLYLSENCSKNKVSNLYL